MVPETNNPARKGLRYTFGRYAVAILSVAAASALRLSLAGILDSSLPYITFYPAVAFASWFGGLGSGLLATFLSAVAALYFFIPPVYQLRPTTPAEAVGAILFAGVSIFIAILNEALRRAQVRSDERLRELALEVERRTAVEKALAESNFEAERGRDLFQTTLSSIGDAVIATDAEGRVTFLNAVAQQLIGWSAAESIGKAISDVFPICNEKTGLPAENPAAKVIRDGGVVTLANHTILVTRDKRQISIEDSAAIIRDDQQRVLGAVLVFRDVTNRRSSEDAIKRSEERLKLALNAGKIGVWDWDVPQNQIEWSDQVYDIYGVERGKSPGALRDFAQLVHPDDRNRVEKSIQAALQGSAPYDVEFRVIHPDQTVHWVATTAQVFRGEQGEPLRMLGATSDITERKRAEEHLRRQWHTFDIALANTPDFTYIFDLEGRFTYVNHGLLSLLQKSLGQVTGKNFFDLDYPPELATRLQRQIQEVIDTKHPVRDQTPFAGPAGVTRHYEYIFMPVLTADGHVEAVTGSTRDVTERNNTEEALRKSEERLNFALEAGGGVGTWDWDVSADRVYCNAEFARLYSVDPVRAAEGAPISDFIDHVHPSDRTRVSTELGRAIETGGHFSGEYRVVQPDGSAKWVYVRGRCHLDQARNPTRFPGVVFDITERKRAEQASEENRDRLRAIFDGTYEYIGLIAPDGTLLEANRASLTFADNTREDVVGRPFWDTPWFTGTPGAREIVRDGVARAAQGDFVRFEATVRRPSGDSPTFDISFHPIRNDSGEVVLIVPEGRDISELKRTEEDLRRSNNELKRVNRELEEFAYVASHDLQEPLRMVNIYTQLILQSLDHPDGAMNMYGGFVQQGVNKMEVLLDDLLNFSRTVHIDDQPLGLADLSVSLKDALSVLQKSIQENDAVIVASPLPVVPGDVSQMTHVFQNLISNALKYRKKTVPPEIRISAAREEDRWIVSVEDNGIGFEEQYANRIFGLFKRLHKDAYPGTGLGLAICKRIVERYGGRMWAEGRLGDGATFRFSLPAVNG